MDVFRLGLFLLITMGVSAEVQLQPLNAVVLRGSKARFNCSSTQATSVMSWTVNKLLVISIIGGSAVLNSTERFSATDFTTPGNYKWELIISNVQRNDAGEVTCQVLGGALQVATLSVQDRGSVEIVGGNQTIMEGAQMEFRCQAVGWYPEPNMSWSVNGVANSCNRSSVTQEDLFNSSCTLTVTAVKNSSVQCLVTVPGLNTPYSNTVFLTVNRGSVEIVGGNQTIMEGAQTEFRCQAVGWYPEPNMSWSVNGVANSCNRSSVTQGDLFTSSCTLTVTAVKNSSVQCLVTVPGLNTPYSNTVFLTVNRGSVEIVGGNQTIMEGAQTEFRCQAVGWYPEPNMSWSVNGVANSCNRSSVTQGDLFTSSCTLTVTAVKNSSVQCLVTVPGLNTPYSNTVFLTVKKPVKRDQTVLIAITVAFSAAALLFLIIYGIVFFCKRRKKQSSYQEEVMRARVQSQNRTPVTQDVRGRDNRGYTTDGHDGHTNNGIWYTNKHQMPDGFLEDDQRKLRHMTIV